MRHIESSIKVETQKPIEASAVKYSLMQRLRSAFHIETVGDGVEAFSLNATSKATAYVFNLNMVIRCEENRIRIMADGSNEISLATRIFYVLSLLLVLLLSLLPSAFENSGSGFPMEAIFFLVVGSFIIYDMNKKIEEPQMLLDRILASVAAEFG